MNADKMAAKMAVYNKKYKKIFPETGTLQEFACKILFYWFLNYKHYPCNITVMLLIHLSELDSQYGVEDGSR